MPRERTSAGSPYSKRSIMRTQRSRSAVIVASPPTEQGASNPDSSQNLGHLFAFPLRDGFDMPTHHRFGVVEFLALRSSSQVVGRRHRKAVGNEIGAAQDQDDARRQVSADHSCD
jgi:hypothetical protein